MERQRACVLAHGCMHDKLVRGRSHVPPSSVARIARYAGGTALHWAAANNEYHLLNLLIERNADLMSRSFGGSTALHVAAGQGHTACVRTLLRSNSDPDAGTSGLVLQSAAFCESEGNSGIGFHICTMCAIS